MMDLLGKGRRLVATREGMPAALTSRILLTLH